ncbi:MAG: SPFH domain-containing protein [Anaerolineae bacterium]|nr:SPFH domain-containing protein [Anaerolineae bacterium]
MSSPREWAPLGITLVDDIGNWLRGAGLRAGFIPLAWDHDRRPGLVWRIPDRDISGASAFSHVQGILVREYEQAIVLHNGVFQAHLPCGVYDVRKVPVKDLVEVIWVSTQVTQHKWGVGRVINRENLTVGAHGHVFLEVADARRFVVSVVAGGRKYTEQDLEDWVFSIVSATMRTQIAASTIQDLMQGQEEFAQACKLRLAEAFGEWGITLKNLVINQFDVPQEYRDAVARVTLARYQRDTTLIDAEAQAEALRIQSKAEAEARLITGGAELELMSRMQSFGLDPIRMKAVEALAQYAQLAAKTGGAEDGGSDMVKLMLFMQMSRLLSDPGLPNEAKDVLRAQFPAQAARLAELQMPAAAVTAAEAEVTRVDEGAASDLEEPDRPRVQRILDNLDERLAAGEISEATYDRLRARWERRLAELTDQEQAGDSATSPAGPGPAGERRRARKARRGRPEEQTP